MVVLLGAAAVAAIGALVLERMPSSGGGEVTDALWLRGARLAMAPSLARGVISIVTVGMGVSLGREAAPQLAGAAAASRLCDWSEVPMWQRRLLLAAGAGAGMAAVYNVPLGGALFAIEVLLGTVTLPLVLPALATSMIATAVAWTALGTSPIYHVPSYGVRGSHIVFALVIGPLAGLAAVGWVKLVARANVVRPRRRTSRVVAPFAVFAVLGAVSIHYPELLGNGSDTVQLAALGALSTGLFAALLALKPLATGGCLASGSPGGLFTPTLTIGVLLAGFVASAWSHVSHGAPVGSYALIGGGAFLAAAMQGPLSAVVLVLELTRRTDALMVPTLIAITIATVIARRMAAPSIYSARLRPHQGQDDGEPRDGPRGDVRELPEEPALR
jgi:H+/Cl- antiporter ClcA